MKTPFYNIQAKAIGEVELPDSVFAQKWNADLVHQAATMYAANARTRVAHTKDRSEVRGGGRKPWQQKGTGRSRHGSSRSPLWAGGGVTFGPRNEKHYEKRMNKKMRRLALATALSEYARRDALRIVEGLSELEPRTKPVALMLAAFFKKARRPSVLFIPRAEAGQFHRASRNIPKTGAATSASVNAGDVVRYQTIFIDKQAVGELAKQHKPL